MYTHLRDTTLVPYQRKVAAIMGASPGQFGGMRMLPHLRQVLNTLGVLVLPGQFSLPQAALGFDPENGMLKAPARLHELLAELVRVAEALSQPRQAAA